MELTPILRARHGDPDTSHEAAAAYNLAKLQAAADVMVAIHKRYGPLADFQQKVLFDQVYGVDCCDHLYQQARSTARDQGWLRDTGKKLVNPLTNRRQIVWEYCEQPPVQVKCCPCCGSVLRERKRLNGKQRPLLALSEEALPEPPVSWT